MSIGSISLGAYVNVIGGYAFKSSDFGDTGYPVIRISNIQNGTIEIMNAVKIEPEKTGNASKYILKSGDILMALSGATTGKLGVVPENLNEPIYLNQRVGKFEIIDDTKVNRSYLRHFLESKNIQNQIWKSAAGVAQPNISPKQLESYSFPLPTITEQIRIAAILDKADALREKRRQAITKLNLFLQSVFLDMFGDPVMNPKAKVGELDAYCKKITDGTHQPPKWADAGIPFLFVSNIKNRKISYETHKFISVSEYGRLTKRNPIEIGDILYTIVGSYGNPAMVRSKQKFAFQRHIAHIKPTEKLIPEFLECMLDSVAVKQQADRRATGIAQKTLILRELKKLKILVPKLKEQMKFAEIARSVERQNVHLFSQMSHLDNLFSTLQQRAFKGEL